MSVSSAAVTTASSTLKLVSSVFIPETSGLLLETGMMQTSTMDSSSAAP